MVFPHALVEGHIGQVSNESGNCMSVCELKVYQPEIFFEGLKLGDDFVRQGAVETPATKVSLRSIGATSFCRHWFAINLCYLSIACPERY